MIRTRYYVYYIYYGTSSHEAIPRQRDGYSSILQITLCSTGKAQITLFPSDAYSISVTRPAKKVACSEL